ncbi:MAG: carbohydrate-binding family 9-like protein, partial [Bacteroidaceae bacterium]
MSANATLQINAPKTSAPVIDGKLEDACWQQTEWKTNFTILNKTKVLAAQQTRFKTVHDNNFLYIAVEFDEPNINGLKAQATKRDGKVYHDDCVEIFVDANRDKSSYKHFCFNSIDTVYDEERRQGGHVGTVLWNSADVKNASTKQQNKWLMEISIPFVELGINGKTTWGMNVTRNRQASGKAQFSTFVPLTGGFQEPANFADLNLKDADLSKFSWDVKAPYDLRTVSMNGEKVLTGKTFITNKTGKFCFVKWIASLASGGEQIQTFALDNNLGKEYSFAVPVGENGSTILTM